MEEAEEHGLAEYVAAHVRERLPPDCREAEARVAEVRRDDVMRTVLHVSLPGGPAATPIVVGRHEHRMRELGLGKAPVLHEVALDLAGRPGTGGPGAMVDLDSYEEALDHLQLMLVAPERNRRCLKDIPHTSLSEGTPELVLRGPAQVARRPERDAGEAGDA